MAKQHYLIEESGFTPDQYKALKAEGKSDPNIYEENLFVNQSTFLKWKERHGLVGYTLRGQYRASKRDNLGSFTVEEYMSLKDQEMLDEDIAKLKDVNKNTLNRWKCKNNVSYRMPKKRRLLDGFTTEEYLSYKNKGLSDVDITDQLYVSSNTLFLWKRDNGLIGVKLRNKAV